MEDNQDKEPSKDEVQSTREYKQTNKQTNKIPLGI
jgi:hypothetical protein